MPVQEMNANVEQILGEDAASLLHHQCKTIPKESLHLPGPDFVERIFAASDRPNRVLSSLQALAGHGREPSRATVAWLGAELVRCRPVTVVVTYRVPTLTLPWVGGFGGGVIETSARHTEVVDPWRSGLPVDDFDPGACGA